MNKINIVLAGQAGQGIQTVEDLVVRVFKKSYYNVFSTKEYMSRVRGGINSTTITVSTEKVDYYSKTIDILFIFTEGTIDWLSSRITSDTVIIGEKKYLKSKEIQPRFEIEFPLTDLSEQSGGVIFSNTIVAGLITGIFDLEINLLNDALNEEFGKKGKDIIEKNILAANIGYKEAKNIKNKLNVNVSLKTDRTVENDILVNGSTAVSLGAVAGGCNFVSFYPMSPSTSVAIYLAHKMDTIDIIVEQFEDEIASANAMLGAWYAGGRGMVTTSGGGFALMEEALSLAGMVESPAVIHLGQRPGPATGLPTRTGQSELFMAMFAGHGEFPRVLFAPGDLYEAFDLSAKAFYIADKYQIPAFILTDQYLLDTYYNVSEFDLSKIETMHYTCVAGKDYKRYEYTDNGVSKRGIPYDSEGVVIFNGNEHDECGDIIEDDFTAKLMQEKRMKKIDNIVREAVEPSYCGNKNSKYLVVCWGSLKNSVKEALKQLQNKEIAIIHFSQVYPLKRDWAKYFEGKKIIVIEQNFSGQFAKLLLMEFGINIYKKILKYDGRPFSVEEIVDDINKVTGDENE